jgi:adenylate cyclase
MSDITLDRIRGCFEGVIPAVLATASASGVPNITHLSRAHAIDGDRIALSNQFFSKTAANLAENPIASLVLVEPATHDEFRLTLRYERTDRRGPVFEQLRDDVDAVAALTGMADVFRLRAADIYRVVEIEHVNARCPDLDAATTWGPDDRRAPSLSAVADLCRRLTRATDLDGLFGVAIDGLDVLLGYAHAHLMLLDEAGSGLYTIASRGFDAESIGAEVQLGDGLIGMAAQRCTPVRVGNLLQMSKYSRTVRRSYEAEREIAPGREIPMPGLPRADSRIVVPSMAAGQLVGAIVVDSETPDAFGPDDEAALVTIASVLANAMETLRVEEATATDEPPAAPGAAHPTSGTTRVRYFEVDGSTFLDGEYLIKGVAGRILRSLLGQYAADGRTDFTNREVRLDPSLELPGFKDNFESRLLLLQRRLEERGAPIRIDRTGRGRFRLLLDTTPELEAVPATPAR